MKLPLVASSLLVLSLFAGPALSGTGTPPGTIVLAQADEAGEAQGGDRIERIKKFLAAKRPSSKLKDDQLQKRLQRAEAFLKTRDLPQDLKDGLTSEIAELQGEMQSRQASGGSTQQPADDSADNSSDTGNESSAGNSGEAAAPASGDAAAVIATDLAGLSNKDLRAQVKKAADLMKASGTSKDDRKKLRDYVKAGRAELDKRKAGGSSASPGEDTPDDNADQQASGASSGTAANGSAAAIINDATPLSSLNDKDLRTRMRSAAKLMRDSATSDADKKKLREIVRAARAEMDKRKGSNSGASGDDSSDADDTMEDDSQPASGSTAGGAAVDSSADAKAKAFLDGKVDVSKMSDADLRKRLADMRAVLAGGKLSKDTSKALRKQLADERQSLRNRVAKSDGGKGGDTKDVVADKTKIDFYLKDKRAARDLNDDELRIRIRIFLDAERDNRYSEAERRFWRDQLARDRQDLNRRLLAFRKKRQDELRVNVNTVKVKFDLGMNFKPDRRPPPYVFAAEADTDDIEEILSAPPRREIKRRYTVAEVENDAELRDAVARIEIDTVKFGFGEGFLREEEIDNLDRIAEIMEEILAVSPGEVFMVEGHTDAVGSDSANLALSRERSAAVKKALSEYYVIPAENLKTVGFGERFLKIPTDEAEAENRRVSVARITPLVGALSN